MPVKRRLRSPRTSVAAGPIALSLSAVTVRPANVADIAGTAISTCHVLPGNLLPDDIRGDRMQAKTLGGEHVDADALEWRERIKLNVDAMVTKGDGPVGASD